MKATVLTLIGSIIAIWALGMYKINTSEVSPVIPSKLSSLQAEAVVTRLGSDGTLYLKKEDNAFMPVLKKGAVMLLTSGKCPDIVNASRSSNDTSKSNPKFYYQCNSKNVNGGQFYLTAGQIKAGVFEVMPPVDLNVAYRKCEDYVRTQLNFPSTYDSNLLKKSNRTFEDGRRSVYVEFTAKNAFGMKLPGSVECKFSPDIKTKSYTMEGLIFTQDK